MVRSLTQARVDYEEDFHAWLGEQAALARARRLDQLDLDNIAEELEGLGRSEGREISNRLDVLVAHLLKLALLPDALPRRGWIRTVREQRRAIRRVIEDSPSLAFYPGSVLADSYDAARETLAGDAGFDRVQLPESCPFTIEQVLDPAFIPERQGTPDGQA